MISQTVWIARHGNRLDFVHPEWFNTAKYPYDPPLSEDGLIQAKQLGQRLKSEKISHIFSSPFLRAIQTANQVAECLDLSIKLESGLSEWLNPEWTPSKPQTESLDILAQEYPSIDTSYNSCVIPQYPETWQQLQHRTANTITKLIKKFPEDIFLVGHSMSVKGIAQGLVDGNPMINTPLCSLIKLVSVGEQWKIELNGDTDHFTIKYI